LRTRQNTAQQLVKREPDNVLYQELAVHLVAQRNTRMRKAVFKRILASSRAGFRAPQLAQVYLSTNRADQATALFTDWIAKNPKDLKPSRHWRKCMRPARTTRTRRNCSLTRMC